MDFYQGDLTDIIRAKGTTTTGSSAQSDGVGGYGHASVSNWEYPSGNSASKYDNNGNNRDSAGGGVDDDNDNGDRKVFGDPFINMSDPFLHDLNMVVASSCSGYFSSPNSTDHRILSSKTTPTSVDDNSCGFSGANISSNFSVSQHHHPRRQVFEKDQMNNTYIPCSLFSRIQISTSTMLPVSPCDSPLPRSFKASPMLSIDLISANTSNNCLINDTNGQLQISSPRNLGIKRRKSQAKKVMCIPAPAAANSRASGEVVPSDLWAWRKYGQKPIKGSPYPRGYYRCSSSKGCSARKQVERSRTDPNMLVITYTSEHNHPWPTQRNALAGSTRSHPPKNINPSSSSSSSSSRTTLHSKEEERDKICRGNDHMWSSTNMAETATADYYASVKEEIEDVKVIDQMNDDTTPTSQSEDLFADLEEIEADPLELLFSHGRRFSEDDEQKGSKGMDSFSVFDW